MAGLLTFPSLEVAVRNGFEIVERFVDGYLVRKRFDSGWQIALVADHPNSHLQEHGDSPYIHFDRGDHQC